jgi:hypothetical protein
VQKESSDTGLKVMEEPDWGKFQSLHIVQELGGRDLICA